MSRHCPAGTTPAPRYAFDTCGATKHITQPIGGGPWQKKKAKLKLNWRLFLSKVKITKPPKLSAKSNGITSFHFSETHYFGPSAVTRAYKATLADKTGRVDNGPFRGFAAGEVLFLGASGSRQGDDHGDLWEITFHFAVIPNSTVRVGENAIAKRGWDHLVLRYADEPATEKRQYAVVKPVAVRVKAHDGTNFSGLGIGTE
jgi:hypothetical protein